MLVGCSPWDCKELEMAEQLSIVQEGIVVQHRELH